MLKNMQKNGGILALSALLATALVALTHQVTASRIQEQEQKQLLQVLNQVIPKDNHDNELYKHCTLIQDQEHLGTSEPMPAYLATQADQPSGVAIEAIAPDGYNGAIKIIVGLDMTGTVTGVRVLAHQETPGLGDKIDTRITRWIDSFTGRKLNGEKDPRWAVRKDGGDFDQFTGATITPRAVVNAVKRVSLYFDAHGESLFTQPANCEGV
ncbi:electron transport complex subunit RsxG [Photobacterium sp. GJ3]|uniref:electron transport complex subunit RsxG n=1 Tax=Photobacterium sp. GJ3 TaxID=2829502 RepID=UPI001B8B3A41|nr:electron transport complex subunit RsxG [Photobacterium sp. GJ3]QUJ69037.1 electron transport complex subunit RsxG [Photobacterium sp. GJ3]